MNGHGGKTRESTLPQRDSLQYELAAIYESNPDVYPLPNSIIRCNQDITTRSLCQRYCSDSAVDILKQIFR